MHHNEALQIVGGQDQVGAARGDITKSAQYRLIERRLGRDASCLRYTVHNGIEDPAMTATAVVGRLLLLVVEQFVEDQKRGRCRRCFLKFPTTRRATILRCIGGACDTMNNDLHAGVSRLPKTRILAVCVM
jgi:hypothetical protein